MRFSFVTSVVFATIALVSASADMTPGGSGAVMARDLALRTVCNCCAVSLEAFMF